MSKITLACDTKEKSLFVEVDGKKLKNVYSVGIFQDGGYFGCDITMIDKPMEEGDLKQITYLRANENGDLVDGSLINEITKMVFPGKD